MAATVTTAVVRAASAGGSLNPQRASIHVTNAAPRTTKATCFPLRRGPLDESGRFGRRRGATLLHYANRPSFASGGVNLGKSCLEGCSFMWSKSTSEKMVR